MAKAVVLGLLLVTAVARAQGREFPYYTPPARAALEAEKLKTIGVALLAMGSLSLAVGVLLAVDFEVINHGSCALPSFNGCTVEPVLSSILLVGGASNLISGAIIHRTGVRSANRAWLMAPTASANSGGLKLSVSF